MKLQMLFVFVLSLQLVFGTDTCSLACTDVIDTTSKFAACAEYTFKVTSSLLSYDEARGECLEMGGDLLQNNLGPAGTQYHDEIYQLAMDYITEGSMEGLWIGYTDRSREGSWRFINGEAYDASNRGQTAVTYWGDGEPSGSWKEDAQNCAKLWRRFGPLELDDVQCDDKYPYRGLCEFKTTKCLA